MWPDAARGRPPTGEDLPTAFIVVLATPSEYWEPDERPPRWWESSVEELLVEWPERIDVELLPPGEFWTNPRLAFLNHW